jgi:hypothetical protein
MRYYQEFNRLAGKMFNSGQLFVHTSTKQLKQSFKEEGLSQEQTNQYMEIKRKDMLSRIKIGLQDAKYFEIEENTKRLVIMTDIPTDKDMLKLIRLPHKFMWIDTEITSDEDDIGCDAIQGMLLIETSLLFDDESRGAGFYCICKVKEGDNVFIDEYKITFLDDVKIYYTNRKTARFLRSFIANLVLLIENPEIEYVTHKRGLSHNLRRQRAGKMPLPDSHLIKLTGKLKVFADELYERTGKGWKLNHRIEVKGFWRHYLDTEHYKNIYSLSEEEWRY